jgi:RNA polymerase sigma-70 factor (sigma-E family)
METMHGLAPRATVVPQEFEDFYKAFRPKLARALVLALGDHDLGVEAADEAMVRTYQQWKRVRTYRNPMGWVYRVGVNWGRSRLRRRRREVAAADESESAASTLETDVDVRQVLAELPLDQRTVVVMRYYLGLSTEETAETLGIKQGTVKSRLSRALERMGDSIGGER